WRLGLYYYGDDHGTAAVVVADPFTDDAAGQLADLMRFGNAVGGRQGQGFLDPGQDLAEGGVVDTRAASLDLGAGHHLARVGVDHDHDRDEALVAQDAAVFELGFGDLADGEAVHVDVAARHRASHAGLAADQVDDNAVLGDHDVVVRDAGQGGEVGVRPQVPPLAVYRHEVARPDQVQHIEQLAGRGVAGHVHQRRGLVHHPGAEPGQPVDHPVHRGLVARDQRGGQDDGVPGGDPDRVVAAGHPGQRRHRLALRSGGDQHHVTGWQLLGLAQLDQEPARHPQVAEVTRDAHVADHGPADEGDLAPVLHRGVEHLLNPVHVRGEAGHDDALPGVAEDLVEHRRDVALRGHPAGDLGVGRVRQQQVDALAAEPGEAGQVGEPAVQRQLVHLEVAGVQHHARRGADGHRERVRDRVVDREELAVERAERAMAALDHLDRDRVETVLGQLAPHQGQGQPGADQRDVGALPEQVGDRADVILVRVRQHERLDLVEPPVQVAEVRQDEIHAGLVGVGEQHAAVHDEQSATVLEDRHVPADLAEAAERDDAQPVARQLAGRGEVGVRVAHSLTPPAVRSSASWCLSASV